MNLPTDPLEKRLQQAVKMMVYPPTPDLSGKVRRRIEHRNPPYLLILRAAGFALAILVLAVVAIPSSRAVLADYLRVGVVRILPRSSEVSASPVDESGTLNAPTDFPNQLRGLVGRTSLDEARMAVKFPILLPSFPPDLGEPEDVYLQTEIPMVVLVWRDPDDSLKVRLSLYEIAFDAVIVSKIEPEIVEETRVGDSFALWAKGPYLLQLTNGSYELRRLVEGHTLVWEMDGITYRLETDLNLEEAIKIAESLH
jgi:hypothetical protein